MKKTITALAAIALAGSLYAAVESVNIVGYTTHDLPVGYTVLTAPFVPVGSDGTAFTLDMIQPNENWDGDYNDNIQFSDDTGRSVMTATYWSGWGWYDIYDEEIELNNTVLDTSMAGFVRTTQQGAQFTVAGEVALDPAEIELPQGYALMGNPLPRSIILGDIIPNASWDGDNNDNVQFFDITGKSVTTATYWTGWGWYDVYDEEIELNNAVLNAGEGFFVRSTQQGASFTFPPAIPVAND